MDRRHFIRTGSIAFTGFTLLPSKVVFGLRDKVKLGFIGVGLRGKDHLREALSREDVEVTDICDIQESSLRTSRDLFVKAKKKLPKEHTGGLDAYKKLLNNKEIDAVIIATPWQYHKDQAVDAMLAGKYVGCEVIAGLSVDDHWDIVNTCEKTKMPYMTLENVCYRRDLLAVLSMVREGLFGELVHVEGGYQHNLRGVLFNNGKEGEKGPLYGPKAFSEAQWRTQFNIDRNGDIYPTHGAGPVMHYLNINRGNRFTNLVSFASKARGLSAYIEEIAPGNEAAKINYKNGDVISTLINCENGETVLLSHDTHLPRPYSLGFRVQGTKGLWMDVSETIYIDHKSKQDDEWDNAKSWLEKYDHPLWKKYASNAEGAGHGGMDWFVFNAFVESVKRKVTPPIDVYDSVTMSVITPLSEKSILENNAPQLFPDFTKGLWRNKTSDFAMNAIY